MTPCMLDPHQICHRACTCAVPRWTKGAHLIAIVGSDLYAVAASHMNQAMLSFISVWYHSMIVLAKVGQQCISKRSAVQIISKLWNRDMGA